MKPYPDFSRDVHCLLGLPFDAIGLAAAATRISEAASSETRCFLSTPNLNFLIAAQTDAAFRDSVINSDLSVADGMPVVWMARLLGIPLRERVAGSDLFEQLGRRSQPKLSVFFFGGPDGVARLACNKLNAEQRGVVCRGFESPGFGSIADMSSAATIDRINSSQADFLLVSLGAKKGQAWIEHNRRRLTVPVISHLGAVVNFVAGKVERAPVWARRLGGEWLWRIKEEPGLWRRYWSDGLAFVRLLLTRVFPHAVFMLLHKPPATAKPSAAITCHDAGASSVLKLGGAWLQQDLIRLREYCAAPGFAKKDVVVEMAEVSYVDSAFMGCMLLLQGACKSNGSTLSFTRVSPRLRKIFKYSCTEHLLQHSA